MNKQNNNKKKTRRGFNNQPKLIQKFNEYKLQMAFVCQAREAIRSYEGRNSIVSRKSGIKMDKLE